MHCRILICFGLLLLVLNPVKVPAQVLDGPEKILSFKARYILLEDGTLEVRELIRVHARNKEIVHGIYRQLPTVYHRPAGEVVVSVVPGAMLRNGSPEPFKVDSAEYFVRFRLGDKGVVVPEGVHRYEINYTIRYPVRYENEAYDELAWNVTGHDWSFMIDSVEAEIVLPPSARILHDKLKAFSGFPGATTCDCVLETISPNSATVRIKTLFLPGEELTIHIPFAKGVVAVQQNPLFVSSVVRTREKLVPGAGMLLLFYLMVWFVAGRRKERSVTGSELPLFAVSPAAVRYICLMKYDAIVLASAVFSLAARGCIAIQKLTAKKEEEDYQLSLLTTGQESISEDEKVLLSYLFKSVNTIRLREKEEGWLSSGSVAHRKVLKRSCSGKYFRHHTGWKIILLAVTIVAIFVMMQGLAAGVVVEGLLGSLAVVGGAFGLVLSIGKIMKAQYLNNDRTLNSLVGEGVGALFVCGFLLFLGYFILQNTETIYFLWTALIGLGLGYVYFLLPRHTEEGRAILKQVTAFRNFADQSSTSFSATDQDAEKMKMLLPYAIALDFHGRFSKLLGPYLHAMYPQQNDVVDTTSSFFYSSQAVRSFSSSLSYAAVSPSSSDSGGSDSGGGSGGGDSGGGGGGW